jgi:ADP-ribosylglycohydrolase
MRTSIVGLTALDNPEATAAAATALADLTHGDPLAANSCVLWSEAVRVRRLREALATRPDLVEELRSPHPHVY